MIDSWASQREHRDQGGLDPGRVEVGVVDEQCPAGRDGRLGVQPLLTASQRQRDVRGRQADGGQLGARHRPRAADHEVGRGVGVLHLFFGPAQLCDGKIKIDARIRFVFQ